MSTRILVAGSRDWADKEGVWNHLDYLLRRIGPDMVLVHGDAKGLDTIARAWAEDRGVAHLPHPADWTRYGKAAGPKRNQEMVDLGAAECHAWPNADSRGTKDCMQRARAAGIPVWNHGEGYS